MGVKLTGDWAKALQFDKRAKAGITAALNKEAEILAKQLRAGLASGSPAGTTLAPLHPLTAALKGSSVPLAGMERWVVVVKVAQFKRFIGMTDPEAVRYGRIHEEGRTWSQTWSERQRRWFFATMSRLGLLTADAGRAHAPPHPNPVHTHATPARPWLEPVWKAYAPAAQRRIRDEIIKAILR